MHDLAQYVPGGHAEFLPLGHQYQRVCIVGRLVHVAGKKYGLAEKAARLVHGHRIVGLYPATGLQQAPDQHQGWRFPHVVGLRFEGQAPDGDGFAFERAAEMIVQLVEQHLFLRFVHPVHRFYEFHGVPVFTSHAYERFHILGEAAASVTGTGVQEFMAYAGVRADPHAHVVHIGPRFLAQVRHLVHERDAGGQHGVGCVFGHLGRRNIHKEHPEILQQERSVKVFHDLAGLFGFHAHHHPVRAHEIADGIAFFQELGVGRYVKGNLHVPLAQFFADDLFDFGGRTYRDRAFCGEYQVVVHVFADGTCHIQYVMDIRASVFVGRCSHGTENDFRVFQAILQFCCKMQTPGNHVPVDHRFQTRFINGQNAFFQVFNFLLINVYARNVCAHLGKTNAGHKSYISCSYYGYIHAVLVWGWEGIFKLPRHHALLKNVFII